MGTTYTVTIKNFNGNKKEFKSKIDSKLKALNKIFSTYDPNSEITKINQSSADIIKISDTFKYVLDKLSAIFWICVGIKCVGIKCVG